MCFLLLKTLSISPVFSLSHDNNFHTITKANLALQYKLRFSLIHIPLGACKLYILTYHDHKFNFIKLLKLDDFYKNVKKICEKTEVFFAKTQQKSQDEKEVIKEALKLKIQEETDRERIAITKVPIYFTLLSLVLSLALLKILDFKKIMEWFGDLQLVSFHKATLAVLFLFLIWYFINAFLFCLKAKGISGYETFKFSDISGSSTHLDCLLLKSMYFKWQNMRQSNLKVVSLILGIEEYIGKFIVIFFLLVLVYNIKNFPIIKW